MCPEYMTVIANVCPKIFILYTQECKVDHQKIVQHLGRRGFATRTAMQKGRRKIMCKGEPEQHVCSAFLYLEGSAARRLGLGARGQLLLVGMVHLHDAEFVVISVDGLDLCPQRVVHTLRLHSPGPGTCSHRLMRAFGVQLHLKHAIEFRTVRLPVPVKGLVVDLALTVAGKR
ncbi:hypothetical protein DL89DRAFT_170428 [Linderina pennispora]|uniref:Uncharacterized protein n=1 Tax=Linderina pennispora TaxID=61395 RepID=A0A1Y1W678_9FUNG|nr:uncharacterized protein DL89DRAFT_170428 [Linderina pennispora]ORX69050.1 hypothetical protein DL89DRAFT_170428 [Linderina pennispora]